MAELNDTLKKVLKECGLDRTAVWKHKQSGKFIVYHWAIEQAAAKKNIIFSAPQIIEANGGAGVASLCVTGRLGEREEWSIGEASPKNNQNTYPWAMAEKRAKDRVVLKLLDLHGVAYSEEEADDFKEGPQQAEPPQGADALIQQIDDCKSEASLMGYRDSGAFKSAFKQLSEEGKAEVTQAGKAAMERLKPKAA